MNIQFIFNMKKVNHNINIDIIILLIFNININNYYCEFQHDRNYNCTGMSEYDHDFMGYCGFVRKVLSISYTK